MDFMDVLDGLMRIYQVIRGRVETQVNSSYNWTSYMQPCV